MIDQTIDLTDDMNFVNGFTRIEDLSGIFIRNIMRHITQFPWNLNEFDPIAFDSQLTSERRSNNDILNEDIYGEFEHPFLMGSGSEKVEKRKRIEFYLDECGGSCHSCGKKITLFNRVHTDNFCTICVKCDEWLEERCMHNTAIKLKDFKDPLIESLKLSEL